MHRQQQQQHLHPVTQHHKNRLPVMTLAQVPLLQQAQQQLLAYCRVLATIQTPIVQTHQVLILKLTLTSLNEMCTQNTGTTQPRPLLLWNTGTIDLLSVSYELHSLELWEFWHCSSVSFWCNHNIVYATVWKLLHVFLNDIFQMNLNQFSFSIYSNLGKNLWRELTDVLAVWMPFLSISQPAT